MWIATNRAFLSAVEHRDNADLLVVRARIEGDLQTMFPKNKVEIHEDRDYRFRTIVTKKEFATALAKEALSIDYGNFKDSVKDKTRAGHYLKIWQVMFNWQESLYGWMRRRNKPMVTHGGYGGGHGSHLRGNTYFHRSRDEGIRMRQDQGYYEGLFGVEQYEGYSNRRPSLDELDGEEDQY